MCTNEKDTIKDKMIRFNEKHPKFRKYMDIFYRFIEKMYVLYWVMAALAVVLPVIIFYYTLPLEIRDEVSVVIGGVLSLIVIPMVLNYINKKTENEFTMFYQNKTLYTDLVEILIGLLTSQEEDFKGKSNLLKKYICENYSLMCVVFPSSLTWDIWYIYKECEYKNNKENENNNDDIIKYFVQKSLHGICKLARKTNKFNLNNSILQLLKEEAQKQQ